MPIFNNETIKNSNLNLGNLDLEIECDVHSTINKNFFVNNYCNNITNKLINITFTYNDKNEEITDYNFKIKSSDDEIKHFKTSVLIVGGGGGGGYNCGGGGGGGRVIYYDKFLLSTNINYNIFVGKGGEKGTHEWQSGESGYNSGISNILAAGGGGGGSYIYDTPSNLLENKTIIFAGQDGKGLNGGSGGGSCCLQYNMETDGNSKGLLQELESYYNYKSFGNNGGSSYYIEKFDDTDKLILRGGGGGGAYENGENNYSITDTHFGKGGDGIVIEKIDIGMGSEYNYCPIISKSNIICNETRHAKIDSSYPHIYWGAGGGGGSCNITAGYGGKGGGGGGGYYENINKLADPNLKGIGGTNFFNINYLNENDETELYTGYNDGLISSEEFKDNMYELARGGNGLNHTGSGGGGGGIGSFGGYGGSGIIILLINTEEEVEEEDYENEDIRLSKLITDFEEKKKTFGINLSKVFYYNIKDNKKFYSYIDKLYDYNLSKSDFVIPFNYDRTIYDSKFHEYIKIIFDLKIDYESFLFYMKKENSNKYIDNNNLFNYQILIILLIDILEDLIIFIREHNDYYKLFNKLKTIEIKYIQKYRKNNYDIDINIDSVKINNDIKNINMLILAKESQLNEKLKLIIPEYNSLSAVQQNIRLNNIKDKKIIDLNNEIRLLQNLKITNEQKLVLNSNEDLYYTYNKNLNHLILYISDNNNYKVRNFHTQEYENIITNTILGADQENVEEDKIILENIQDYFKYNNIDEFIKQNELNNAEKLNDFIKIYLYTFLNVKEYNFNRNLLTQYIYFNQILILQTLYKDSEKLLIAQNIYSNNSYEKTETDTEVLNICGTNNNGLYQEGLYDLLSYNDNIIRNIKSFSGYGFINEYINDFKINYGIIISISCPYLTIKFSEYDSNRIKKYFRESVRNDTDNFEINKEEKYYNNLINSFLIEIDNKRFNITKFNFIDQNIISITIEDRSYKFCKIDNIKRIDQLCKQNIFDLETENILDKDKYKICNILIVQKDNTFITNTYQTDVEKIEYYNEKINNYKKNLDNIDEGYNKLKNKHDSITKKSLIFYFITGIITISIIFIYLFDITTNSKSISLIIILFIILLMIIINYFTKKYYEDIIETFESEDENYNIIKDFRYYKINKGTVIINTKENQHWIIKITLSRIDQNNLKFMKKQTNDIEELKKILINNLIILQSDLELSKIINLEFNIEDDANFNYITHISFFSNKFIELTSELHDITILKQEDDIYHSLIYNHDYYKTWKYDANKCLLYIQDQDQDETKKLETYKLIHIYTIRNDLLKYFNNRYSEINKIIESIELEKANNIYNKVDKVLKNEKRTYNNYYNEYIYKKNHNSNINNLYKHRIIFQGNFVNMGLIFYLIVILILLLLNIFPNNIILILIIGFVTLLINIILFSIKILHRTRKNPNYKYWSKPDEIIK